MSGFTGVPGNPVLVDDTVDSLPFASISYADQVGVTETISVTLYFDQNAIGNDGAPLTALGSISDPSNSGSFDPSTDSYTATAFVTGDLTPATSILDQLVYTPPPVSDGTSPSVSAEISVVSTNASGAQTSYSLANETLQLATPPAIEGTVADQPVAAGNALYPFQSAYVVDGDYGSDPSLNETITITDNGVATDADGILTGPGLSKTGAGTYALSGYNSSDLSDLVFTATAGITATAVFTLTASDSVTQYSSTDSTTSVDIIGPTVTGSQFIVLNGSQSVTAAAGDTVLASTGNDLVEAPSGQVFVTGASGTLEFIGGSAASTVTGGSGSSTIFGGSGGGYYTGGRGGNNIMVSQGASGANTTLTGASGGNEIFGSAGGNDHLIAGSGHDTILGGSGNTTIQGGGGSDVIFTSGGASTVYGSAAGADTVVGNSGSLAVNAQGGDAIFGGNGALDVTGSKTGADSVIGGSGPLAFNGQGGNALIVGASSTSSITIGDGASLVFTGTGDTSVTGGSGSLTVQLGAGDADITEGSGASIYQVINGEADGSDFVTGFRPGTDQIQLFGYLSSDLTVSTAGGSTLVSLSDGTKIDLVGVSSTGNSIIIA